MNRLPAGYKSRGDGTCQRVVEFRIGTSFNYDRETLVRSRTGRLLRVERPGQNVRVIVRVLPCPP